MSRALTYQERGHGYVETGPEAAVDPEQGRLPKAVEDQSAVGFGEAELPGRAGVLDGREGAVGQMQAGRQASQTPGGLHQ